MKNKIQILFLLLLGWTGSLAVAQVQLVFEGGKEGHAIYRIPPIISLPNGDLIAFAEGRVNGSDDFGDVNLVTGEKTILAHSNNANESDRNNLTVKISFDEGKTWELTIPIDYTGDRSQLPWTAYSDLVKLDENTLGIL